MQDRLQVPPHTIVAHGYNVVDVTANYKRNIIKLDLQLRTY